MKRFSLLLFLVLGLQVQPALSDSPSVAELVSAIVRNHPEFLATAARTFQVAQERQEADAAFDARLVQDTYVRPSGFYDGRYMDQRVVQPIADMNAQVFGGYRISNGQFPVYEAEYETVEQGEASIGVKLSLLQNREIDSRRLALATAAWRYSEAESQQTAELNRLVYSGVTAYLDWYASHRKLAVIQDLVVLTQDRLSGVEARVADGDLARITLTEFETTLLARQLLAREAEQNFELARQRLAYFWRPDDDPSFQANRPGEPPTTMDWPFRAPSTEPANYADTVDQHPGVAALSAKVEQARNRRIAAENETLPELDLEMKLARDLGDGEEFLTGTESIVGLSFYMPIGQRAARAREASASAEIRELEYEIAALREQIQRDVELSLNAIEFGQRILKLSRRQEELAETLLEQERARFNEGVSDQFLLIAREASALESHLRTIDAEVSVFRQELVLGATLAVLAPPL